MAVSISQFGNVPANLVNNANFTLSIVNEIFAVFPGRFRFVSGYRSPSQNSSVNGVDGSYHLKALAADFVPIDATFPTDELARIGKIVSKYSYEVIKHNAGSGLHYHIEPNPQFYAGHSQGTLQNFAPANSQMNDAAPVVALIVVLALIA